MIVSPKNPSAYPREKINLCIKNLLNLRLDNVIDVHLNYFNIFSEIFGKLSLSL